MAGMMGGRMQTAARASGVMRAALTAAVRYAKDRRVFDAALIDYPLTQIKIARMAARFAACRQLAYAVARLLDSGGGRMEASVVKLLACRSAELVTREALQIHGGMGYAEETPVSRYFVDARVLSIFEGAEETLALKVVAKSLLESALTRPAVARAKDGYASRRAGDASQGREAGFDDEVADGWRFDPYRFARDRGIRVRCRPAGRHDDGAARCRRHPHRPAGRRTRLPALAGHRGRRQPLLVRPQQRQAFRFGRSRVSRGTRARDGADLCARCRRGHAVDQLSAARIPVVRGLAPATSRPDPADDPDRHGGSAIDNTVNARVGIPFLTGEGDANQIVNHLLPAWDLVTGQMAAVGLLAAERHRRLKHEGQHVRLALEDMALAAIGHLGFIAEAQLGVTRERVGNDMFGAFGRDFATADGEHVMVVGLTPKQWRGLCAATGLGAQIAELAASLGLDLEAEGNRFRARGPIGALVGGWIKAHRLADVAAAFDAHGVCWGKYQTVAELVRSDSACSEANPMFSTVEQPGVGPYLVPGVPLSFSAVPRVPPRPAPRLGEHTEEVLTGVLGLGSAEIGRLFDRRVIGRPHGNGGDTD
jgi:hypothetical protein